MKLNPNQLVFPILIEIPGTVINSSKPKLARKRKVTKVPVLDIRGKLTRTWERWAKAAIKRLP